MRYEYTYQADVPQDGEVLGKCYYCGQPASAVDHVIPRVLLYQLGVLDDEETTHHLYGRHKVRTVPACRECNSILGSKYFSHLEERKAWLKDRLRQRYKGLLSMPDWSIDELTELDGSLQDYVIQSMRLKRLMRQRIAW